MTPKTIAARTTVLYAAGAALWILLSDGLLAASFRDAETIARLSMYKGWAFVACTALLLYLSLRTTLDRLEAENHRRAQAEAERNRGEREIARLTRVYATLSSINESVARARSQAELFGEVCAIACTEAGYKLALVTWRSEEDGQLAPIFAGGESREFLADVSVRRREHHVLPETRAFAQGKREIVNDVSLDSSPASWRERASQFGLASAAAFPIRVDGELRGVFSVYSSERRAFVGQEVELLEHAVGNICFALDTLERERLRARAELALKENEERFRRMTESVPAGLIVVHGETFGFVNQQARVLLGFEAGADLSGRAVSEHVHPDDRDAFSRAIRDLIESGAPRLLPEVRLVRIDGGAIEAELSAVPFEEGGAPASLVFFRDIGAQRSLEKQLRQSQKMEAIGTLAGGVAHDFNNILTVILGNASLLDPTLEDDPRRQGLVREIEEAATRASELTRQLLLFSRQQALKPTAIDVNDVVTHLSKMLRRILGEDVTFQTHCARSLPLIRGDVPMFEQVLMNLAVNARDAMPQGGKLTISTRVEDAVRPTLSEPERAKREPCVVVSVSDTGTGIPPDVLPHIFEPFFTTKDVGRGTGLGLATAYGIVEQHQGWITVDTRVGTGTTFHIYLPVSESPRVLKATATAPQTLAGGLETILVVEDEPTVRRAVVGILRHCGYTVLEAGSGPEALTVWSKARGEIRLLITDCVMPLGVSGIELADRLLRDDPMLRVVYTSGYRADGIDASRLELGVNFLPKPFDASTLTEVVRRQLDAIKN